MSSKPTLVFVHGAWHTPECFEKIIAPLETDGFKCIAPQMAYSGAEPPVKSIKSDVEILRSIIRSEIEQGNNVVIIVHSFGGVVGFSAVEGLTRGKIHAPDHLGSPTLIGAVGVASALGMTGVSAFADTDRRPPHWDVREEKGIILAMTPEDIFYQDLPSEEAKKWVSKLRPQSKAAVYNGEGVYAGHFDLPVWYLVCTEDRAIPPPKQEAWVSQAQEAGANVTVRRIACGHFPMLVKPKETAQFITDAVNAFHEA